MAIEDDEIHQILQDKDTLFRLQSVCPDYADIVMYLTDSSSPEERKLSDKVVSESQHYWMDFCIISFNDAANASLMNLNPSINLLYHETFGQTHSLHTMTALQVVDILALTKYVSPLCKNTTGHE